LEPTTAKFLIACPREAGSGCPYCEHEVVVGDPILVCQSCGTVHHRNCWRTHNRCGSYTCAPARRDLKTGDQAGAETRAPVLTITTEELLRAQPIPTRPIPQGLNPTTRSLPPAPAVSGTNRLAIASLICAVVGIPLFGLVTGLVAIGLGVAALGSIRQTAQKGLTLALSGVLLGLADVVGWLVLLWVVLGGVGVDRHADVTFSELPPDLAATADLAPELARAMRANVLIEQTRGLGLLGGRASGSGVIMELSEGEALIVTNRHVVDPSYPSSNQVSDGTPAGLGTLDVTMLGRPSGVGRVVWVAPEGIDLALVRVAAGVSGQAQAAPWSKGRAMRVGESVFAIGNPHRLGWTHTQGVISQFRLQERGGRPVRVIQTQAAINPGNSGGGLYDREGYLIGINTWTGDKRISEGIGFAIALDTLLDLKPAELKSKGAEPEHEGGKRVSGK
jgi:hypothetical protein